MPDSPLPIFFYTFNDLLKGAANRIRVPNGTLGIENVFFDCQLFSFFVGDFSSGLVCFMAEKTDLNVRISFFPHILQPVTDMLEGAPFGDIIDDDGCVHFAIVAV